MADDEQGEGGTPSRGADWEVVSLTASAYASAPGPNDFDPTNESKEKENITERESSAALFMSAHFAFPPSEHENLPVESDVSEIHGEPEGHNASLLVVDDDNVLDKGSSISIDDMGFEEDTNQRLNLVGMEQGMFADSESVAFRSGAHETGTKVETEESSNMNADSLEDHTKQIANESNSDVSDPPCQAWWKRHAASLYHHAKEANTFWSVVVAAAVMGLVILGRRWQRDKWQLHQIKWRSSINNERMSSVLGPTGLFKDALVDGHHPSSLIRGVGAAASL